MHINKLEAGSLYLHFAKDHDPRHEELKKSLENHLEWITIDLPCKIEEVKLPFFYDYTHSGYFPRRVCVTQYGVHKNKDGDVYKLKGFLLL